MIQHLNKSGQVRRRPHLSKEDLEGAVPLAEVAGNRHDDDGLAFKRAAASRRRGRERTKARRVGALGEIREPELFNRLDGEVLR